MTLDVLALTNTVFAVGSILFTVALLPSLLNPKAAIPATTSTLTASMLWTYVGMYSLLYGPMSFSALAGASTALAWTLLLFFRRPKRPFEPKETSPARVV